MLIQLIKIDDLLIQYQIASRDKAADEERRP
jgi:hypothetical protein